MRDLVDLLPKLQFGDHAGPSPGAVQAESLPHLFVAGLHVPGGRIEVIRSCSDLPAVVKYMTAFVRANIDVPFAAVSLSDGSLLAPCRDIHNKHGSSGVAVPLGRPRHRGWRTLECGSGQLRPVVGSSTGLPSLCNVQQQSLPLLGDGRDYCRLPQPGPLLPACFPCRSPIPPMLTASHLCSATSSLTPPSHLPLPPAWRSACVSSAPPEPSLHWDRVDLS